MRGAQHATHPEWELRPSAAVYRDGRASFANFYPFARDLCQWLQQKRTGLMWTHRYSDDSGYTNPYTHHASALSAMIGRAVNDAADFASKDRGSLIDLQVQRLRLHNELLLSAVRFCEAAIKQMLFCTAVPDSIYKKASLGQLLAMPCAGCRKSGSPGHDISLLGALAHHYFLCHEFDHCVYDHLALLNRRRIREAAHAELIDVTVSSEAEIKEQVRQDLNEIGHELGHMSQHIGAVEERMLAEIELYIASAPHAPSMAALTQIPVRIQREWIQQIRAQAADEPD